MATRLSPFFDLDLFTRAWDAPSFAASAPMDAVRTEDALELRFDLPGYDPESIDLSVERHVLTLSAERNWVIGDHDRVVARERRHGRVRRQLRLSESLDTSKVEARYDDGVLRVRIPVADEAQPHKVRVAIGSGEVAGAAALEDGSVN